jgi:cholesterol transport system auxiliary component
MKNFAVLVFTLFLAACAGGVRNTAAPNVYDFGMPSSRLAAEGAWSKLAFEIKAPYWFDALSIEYRLLYEDPLKLRDYAGSRWAGAPALLLAQRLRQQLGMHGATSNIAVDCLLRIEVQEFSHVFDTPQQSRGVLHGSLSLLNAKRQQLAARPIAISQPALTADARGGVAALVAASDALGKEIAVWLESVPGAAVCRGVAQ